MSDEKNPHETDEWKLRTLCTGLDVDKEEGQRMLDAGLVGGDAPPTTKQVASALELGKISEASAEKLLRGAYRIPPPMPEMPVPMGGAAVEYVGGPAPQERPVTTEPTTMEDFAEKFGQKSPPQHWLEKMGEPRLAKPGVRYVVGDVPLTAVLRPMRCPIFDTVFVPMDGRLDVHAFNDSKWFPDHTPKDPLHDCNMTCDGMLGMPIEYDLYYLEIVFEKFAHPEDVRRVLRSMSLRWYFGQNSPWLKTTLAQFTPSFCYEDLNGEKETVEKALKKFAEQGVWPIYRHEMRTPEGRPRRIHSTESFRCHIEGDAGELYAPVRMKVKMQDTLYAQV